MLTSYFSVAKIFSTLILLTAIPLLPVRTCPQVAGVADVGRNAIEQETRNTLHLGNEALFLARRPDLEQELIGLQYVIKSPGLKPGTKIPVGCIEIMDIKRGGFKVENNQITTGAIDLDDAPVWRAAYDCTQDKVFHLHGFSDDESGFSNLMRVLDIHPNSESDALVLASDFMMLTYRESRDAGIRDELSLMAALIRDYQGPRNWKAFSTTWNKCPTSVKSQIARPSVTAVTQGYEVTLFTYVPRRVTKTSVLLRRNGTLSIIESKELFAWND